MNLEEVFQQITTKYAEDMRIWEESYVWAFIVEQIKNLKERGENPADYEIIYVNTLPREIEDGFSAGRSLRLVKIE